MTATNALTISVLGPVTVAVGGVAVPIGGPKPLAVVALLTMEANRVVSDDRLIEAVWPASRPLSAAKTLYTMVSRLRSAVGPELRIERVEDGYRLVLDADDSDVGRVEGLVRRARDLRPQDPAAALGLCTEALAAWRGRPYGQFESAAFAVREVARLHALRLSVVEQRIGMLIDLDPAAAVTELESLVLEHPLQERLWGQLMLALYRSGRSSDALGAFQRARTGLATELGLEPGADLQRLQHSILVRDPSLDHTTTGSPPSPASPPAPAATPSLPSGQGVLLFAEVSGWEQLFADPAPGDRQALRALWDRFDALVADHGGMVFARRAHQRRAVFAAPAPALDAAWAARRLDGVHDDGAPVLRQAVHADQLIEVAGDYLGASIRRAERLLGQARAGVVTAEVALPLPAAVAAAAAWTPSVPGEPRGLFVLGDPDRVASLLAELTPAPRPAEDLVSFVGRRSEQREITELWRRSRLVTLAGIGGIGKTRLATRIAATEELVSGQRSVMVELAPVRDEALVLRQVGVAVGVGDAADEELVDAIAEEVGTQPFDLVLDNCEHVQASAARVAERLLRAVPRLRILATSREPLKIPGEVIFRLPPLDTAPTGADAAELADASRLFVDRARDNSPSLVVTPADAVDIQSICERLDGIPLAIELVAARVRHLGIADLAERIDTRMALLIKGEPTRPARHLTLGAAIDWSYDLLDPSTATLFAELSVFTGGWTLAAADAVGIASRERTADLLADLVDKSLVVADMRQGRVRYRMLETVRVYAGDRLTAEPTAQAAREAHARWYTEFVKKAARDIEGSDLARAVENLDVEHANIRAALTWAVDNRQLELAAELAAALAPYWTTRGLLAEGAEWLDRLLAVGDALTAPLRVAVLEARAEIAMNVDSTSAPAALEEALELARAVGDARVIARIVAALGLQRRLTGDVAAAEELYAEALVLFQSIGDLPGIALAHGRIGDLAFLACDGERAREHLTEAARLQQRLDLPKDLSWSLGGMALVEGALGDTERAEGIAIEALHMFEDVDDTVGTAWSMCVLGVIALQSDEPARAERHYGEALRILLTIGEGKDAAWALEGVGLARLALGDTDGAREHLFRSLDLAVEANQVGRIGTLIGFFGLTQAADADWGTAARCLLSSRALLRAAGRGEWPRDSARIDAALAASRQALGKDVFTGLEAAVSGTNEHTVALGLRSLPRRTVSRKVPLG